jgi:hypothetical protein
LTKPIDAKRAKLLAELEYLVGNNCYNPKIQNYGAHGIYHGEGRSIRYPLTTLNSDHEPVKSRGKALPDDAKELSTGYYAFGVNRLHIIKALDEVLRHLEDNHGLKL